MKTSFISDAQDHITKYAVASGAAGLVPSGTLLFVVRGMILAHTFPVALTTREVAFNQDMRSIIAREGVHAPYLLRALQHEAMSILFAVKEATHGTLRLDSDTLRPWPVPLPSLSEQRRIVAKVEALLEQVNRAKERLAKVPLILKRFRQAVLAAACSGKLTESWRGRTNPKQPFSAPIADTSDLPELPPIPDEWALVPLGAVVNRFQYGTSEKADSTASTGMPILRMGNIQEGGLDLADLKYIFKSDALADFRVRPGDILFNRTNSPELVGKTAVVDTASPMVFASYLIRMSVKPTLVRPAFVAWWINSAWGRRWAAYVRTDGVSQSNINASKLAAMPLPLPPLQEQDEALRVGGHVLELATAIERRSQVAATRADRLRKAILFKAFSGELVPTEAELARAEGREYESASALLARLTKSAVEDKPAKPPSQRARAS